MIHNKEKDFFSSSDDVDSSLCIAIANYHENMDPYIDSSELGESSQEKPQYHHPRQPLQISNSVSLTQEKISTVPRRSISESTLPKLILHDKDKKKLTKVATRQTTRKSSVSPPLQNSAPLQSSQPAYMGDILDDIFGGNFRTPGVKASEDILLTKTVTAAIAFEELEQIRRSPALFVLFYQDSKEHKVLESLHFILEVEEYMALPEEYRMVREKEIIETYINTGSLYEINVTDAQRKTINEKSGKADAATFLDAQKYITHMLIRNVDSTWEYKKNPPKKELKGKAIKKAIDKASDEERLRDLMYYFVARRITPLMYKARTSVVSLQRKVRTSAPIGFVHVTIKELTGYQPKSSSALTIYINGKCIYKNSAGIIRDKKTKLRTSPKRGVNTFTWNERLSFEVKDVESQSIEFHLWEKRLTPNSGIGWFIIDLKDLIPTYSDEVFDDICVDLIDAIGKITLGIHYVPDKEEIARQEEEKERREKSLRTTTTSEFDFY